jgi:hypothetical protein
VEVSEGTQPQARPPGMGEKEWQMQLKAGLVPPQPDAAQAPYTVEHKFSTISFFINGISSSHASCSLVPFACPCTKPRSPMLCTLVLPDTHGRGQCHY